MKSKHIGMTLIELLIVISIIGILAAVATPNILSMIRNNQLTTKTNGLVQAINYLRSETLTRPNKILRIVPINNDWNTGWEVIDDSKNDGWDTIADDEIIKIFEFKDKISITVSKGPNFIAYLRRGSVQTKYEFQICGNGISKGRVVTIEKLGRVSTANFSCS